MKKIIFTLSMAIVFGLGAQAQFSNLAKKAKDAVKSKVENTAKNAVDNAVENAKTEAKSKIDMAIEYKTQANAPQLTGTYDVDNVYDCFDYWANLQEMANKKKDMEWLCSDKGNKMTEYYNMLQNDKSKEVARFHTWSDTQKRFKEVSEATSALVYDGYPDSKNYTDNNAFMAEALKWYVNKAKKGKKNAKNFYTVNGAAIRYLGFYSGRYSDTPEIQKQTNELCKLYDDKVDADYKAKYPNANPHTTYDAIQEEAAKDKKESEEKKAKEAAEKKAKIEASKQTLKAGSLNKSLNAKVLKLAKERVPNCTKVVVINNSWDVQREYGSIVRRVVLAWVVYKDEDGNLVANDYGFCQDYMGGGKYGELKNYSTGVRSVYVK